MMVFPHSFRVEFDFFSFRPSHCRDSAVIQSGFHRHFCWFFFSITKTDKRDVLLLCPALVWVLPADTAALNKAAQTDFHL